MLHHGETEAATRLCVWCGAKVLYSIDAKFHGTWLAPELPNVLTTAEPGRFSCWYSETSRQWHGHEAL